MKKYNTSLLIILILIITNTYLYSMENDIPLTTDQLIEQCKNKYKEALEYFAKKLQPPNTIYVPLWNAHSISSTPTMENPLIISAFYLINCVATGLHIEYDNGDQYASITHFPTIDFNKHREAIKTLCAEAITKQHETKRIATINFFIVEPGKYEKGGGLTIDHDNCIFPCHPLEYYAKKELEKIKPIIITHFPYNISQNSLKQPKMVKITLYPDNVCIMVL